ncbi:MAG: tripartite tricarboxylate transporter substrate binding protein [Betaproteobacteria bacterium]
MTVPTSIARTALLALWAFAGAVVVPKAHAQQECPSKRVTFVVQFTPGGAGDLIARAMATRLTATWGQPVVVENRPGAGGNTGSRSVAQAAPDGHTILIGSTSSHAINSSLYGPRMPYDVQRDFVAIVMVANSPHILMVNPSLPAASLSELIAYARANPGKLNFSSGGNGTSTHLAGELLNATANIRIQHIPYRGAPEAVAGVVAGDTQMMFENLSGALSQIRSGRLRGIAITSASRSPKAAGLPAVAEQFPGFETGVWFGIFAPAATPAPLVKRLNSDLAMLIASPDMREQFDRLGMDPMGGSPAEAGAFVAAEIAKWAKVVASSGATID